MLSHFFPLLMPRAYIFIIVYLQQWNNNYYYNVLVSQIIWETKYGTKTTLDLSSGNKITPAAVMQHILAFIFNTFFQKERRET